MAHEQSIRSLPMLLAALRLTETATIDYADVDLDELEAGLSDRDEATVFRELRDGSDDDPGLLYELLVLACWQLWDEGRYLGLKPIAQYLSPVGRVQDKGAGVC